jgi:hypothetical protein
VEWVGEGAPADEETELLRRAIAMRGLRTSGAISDLRIGGGASPWAR